MTVVANNVASFTHLSPTFYTLNYSGTYSAGVAAYVTCTGGVFSCSDSGTNNFGSWAGQTLTTESFTSWAHGLGFKVVPAIYAGADNGGNDSSVQAILCDGSSTSCAAQSAFISAMVTEAVKNGYDGYNLDWEVGSGVTHAYAQAFVAFANAFKSALTAKLPAASLSVDAIVSNINGTWCSGNNGYLDFSLLSSSSIDRVIIEDYVSNMTQSGWTAPMSCAATNPWGSTVLNDSSPVGCDDSVTGMMNFMCAPNLGTTATLDLSKAVIGLEASVNGTNPVAGQAFSALATYGFTKVAVWPQYDNNANPFLSTDGMSPASATWPALLHTFLTE